MSLTWPYRSRYDSSAAWSISSYRTAWLPSRLLWPSRIIDGVLRCSSLTSLSKDSMAYSFKISALTFLLRSSTYLCRAALCWNGESYWLLLRSLPWLTVSISSSVVLLFKCIRAVTIPPGLVELNTELLAPCEPMPLRASTPIDWSTDLVRITLLRWEGFTLRRLVFI